jgi:hypothetical protein
MLVMENHLALCQVEFPSGYHRSSGLPQIIDLRSAVICRIRIIRWEAHAKTRVGGLSLNPFRFEAKPHTRFLIND